MKYATIIAAIALFATGALAMPNPNPNPEAEAEASPQTCACLGHSCYDTCGQNLCC